MTTRRRTPELTLAIDNSGRDIPLHGAMRRWRADRRQLESELIADASGVSQALAVLEALLPRTDTGADYNET